MEGAEERPQEDARGPLALPPAPADLRTTSPGGDRSDGSLSPLGSDYSDGPHRLVADPDSPTSRLLERAAQRHQAQAQAASASGTPEKFSFMRDIARNPELARAARAALSSSPTSAGAPPGALGALGGGAGRASGLQLFGASALESLAAVVGQLDLDAGEESRINQGMSAALLGRLQSGRAAAERTLGVLQAFGHAEAAYARALSSVATLRLSGEADGPSLRAAMERASALPQLAGAAHSSVAQRLQAAIKTVQALVADLRAACEEVGSGAARAKREVDASRQGLKGALRAHQEAVAAFEAAAAARARPGGRGRAVEADPWLTEGCLVEQQVRLQRALHVERAYLAKAFQRVGDLERRRAAGEAAALAQFVDAYRSALVPIQAVADELAALLGRVDPEADLAPFSGIAASSCASAEALSGRQREATDQLCSELLGSAEIMRQGSMERWDSGASRWQRGHLVLTQAGFIHFFPPDSAAAMAAAASGIGGAPPPPDDASNGASDAAAAPAAGAASRSSSAGQLSWGGASSWAPPLESLALARCAFEQGEAPVFRIIESGGGGLGGLGGLFGVARGRSATLRAADVHDCMEWCAVVREAIAACSG